MTKEEATKYLIKPICTSTIESKEYRKQLEAYTTAVESLNCGEERRMKEYIVHPPKNNLLVIEEYSTFYGEPVKELIRCKDCVHWCPLLDSDHPNTENCKTAYCTIHSIHFETPREGYCYRAERKK